jgi:DnaK suppressor protein
MAINPQAAEKRLLDLRQELEATAASSAESRKPVELDQQSVGRLSRMDALQVQAMANETERRRQSEIKRIDAALERIGEDEYGWCITCGEEIAEKRLDLDPAASQCIDCARPGG